MSYIVFDFRCPVCGTEARDTLVKKTPSIRPPECEEGHPATCMVKLAPGTRTTFRFADQKLKR